LFTDQTGTWFQDDVVDDRVLGQICIDCHKGIAHKLPKEYKEDGED
jgi:nitrate/TMAO reductase-like tetraheme cytochrome c subunit